MESIIHLPFPFWLRTEVLSREETADSRSCPSLLILYFPQRDFPFHAATRVTVILPIVSFPSFI